MPIYATTSYVFKDTEHAANLFGLSEFGNIYTRLMNPTNDVMEKRIAALDGGVTGLAFASGQAAITAACLTLAHSGQNIVSATSLYGGTWTLFTQTFKQLGIEVRFFDSSKPEDIHGLVDEHPLRLHGVHRQPRAGRAGLQGHRRRRALGPARSDPGSVRQPR